MTILLDADGPFKGCEDGHSQRPLEPLPCESPQPGGATTGPATASAHAGDRRHIAPADSQHHGRAARRRRLSAALGTGYLPLGTTAHKQGRIAGENALGRTREFAGSLGTQVVKIFDLVAARTGLRDHEATAAGFDPLTVASQADDHKAYYPGSHRITMRYTGDRRTGQLLGVQLVGHRSASLSVEAPQGCKRCRLLLGDECGRLTAANWSALPDTVSHVGASYVGCVASRRGRHLEREDQPRDLPAGCRPTFDANRPAPP